MGVSDHFAWIVACAQASSHEFVETELLRPRYLNDAVHWRAHGDLAHRSGDIVSRDGLDEHGCQANLLPSVAA